MDKWDLNKINETIEELRQDGVLCFSFGYNSLIELENLDEYAFSKRPDLILKVSSCRDDRTLRDEDIQLLSKLKNVNKIHLNNICNTFLPDIEIMGKINDLAITPFNKILDLKFIKNCSGLKHLSINGKIKNIEAIAECINLEYLYLSTTIKNYNFIEPLNKLAKITIDHCISTNDFSLLNKPTLEEIKILSIKNMENIDSIKDFSFVRKLHLDASRIKLLPKMDKLVNLKELELRNFKIWENPDVLKNIPRLKKIRLEEINTKIKAERFFFLTEMETLEEVDFEFIDFNKTRIGKLNKWFIENGKENAIKK
jgi:hypothetical protein